MDGLATTPTRSNRVLPTWMNGLTVSGILLMLFALFVFLAYHFVWGWSGFIPVPTSTTMSNPKYLWDWLGLLTVPTGFVGAIVTALTTWNTSRNENKAATLKANIGQSVLTPPQQREMGKNMARAWCITTIPQLPKYLRAEVIAYLVRSGLVVDEEKKPLNLLQKFADEGMSFPHMAFVEAQTHFEDTSAYAFIDRQTLAKLYNG